MSTFGAHAGVWRLPPDPRGQLAADGATWELVEEPRLVRFTRRGRVAGAVAGLAGSAAILMVVAGLPASSPTSVDRAGRAAASDVTSVSSRRVVVAQGDSLWEIALRLNPEGDPRETVVRLRRLNGLESNLIHPGQVLLVPGDS